MHATLFEAIPRISNWLTRFIQTEDSNSATIDFGHCEGSKALGITEVVDIEEMAWAPRYGLKGMIDALVCVKIKSDTGGSYERVMPLEFKTGKGTTGHAHGGNSESSGLGDAFDSLVNHWDRLIDLEAKASQVGKKGFLRPRSLNGESTSNSLSSIILDGRNAVSVDASGKSERYIYHFVRQKVHHETNEEVDSPGPRVNNLDCALRSGDCVVSLGPLMLASQFVLVGDHYQLPPLVQFPASRMVLSMQRYMVDLTK